MKLLSVIVSARLFFPQKKAEGNFSIEKFLAVPALSFLRKGRCLPVILLFALCWPLSGLTLPLTPNPPEVAAGAYILMDFHSGQILMEKDADKRMEPASLTKLMTAYAVFSELKSGEIKHTDKVRVSEKAWRMGGSRMYIEVGSEVGVEDLMKGMIVQSGNDASVALAEFVAGSEESFAAVMNQYAKNLGLKNTHYVNSTGMPAKQHYTSARDMAKMAAALIKDFPEYYRLYSQREYTYNNITQQNRNSLLWRNKYVDGMKTGYTKSAGYCLIASAKRDNMRLISVVLGVKTKKVRAQESQKMLTYGLRFYETHRIYKANETLDTKRAWKGHIDNLLLGLQENLYITVPKGRYNELKAILEVNNRAIAPITKGERRGILKVILDGKLLATRPLIALNAVEEGNFFQQLWDYILLLFE
ncbi:MAG: D-alanyl-D-alanine carboxypeptidase [Gammaproteobacteria bacterium]|nr:D-alanyl-D-alanine carboxypeptidase [Gammaproteobacteria bacterium]